ncbi:AhpC/TSA family protein [Vibrio sp. 2-Bac 85]
MTTLKQQTEAKVEAGRKGNPDFMAGVDQVIAQAKSFQQGKDALDAGKNAPNFELPDAQGKSISLADLLIKGPVVITFYRGSWCPYCNLQLKALQAQLADIQTLGATLVAISPQIPDGSLTADEINNMGFTVLSDQDAKVAAEYGVAWQVPDFLLDHMRNDRQLDLEAINNGNANIIPIPATFILNSDGEVTWRFVDLDYRIRSEPSDIIEALQKL